MKRTYPLLIITALALLGAGSPSFGAEKTSAPQPAAGAGKTLIDYFLPIPIKGKLSSDAWGAADVGPRDQDNGLEDRANKEWCYWDGAAIKAADGKWHLFASKWPESAGHRGWSKSVAVHAVSDDVLGPYTDTGLLWPNNQGGKGHNVTALMMPDGRYAITISETRPGEVFVSKSLDGPWESLGLITVKDRPDWKASNVTPILRPDGKYMVVQRGGEIMLSDNIVGPYEVQGTSIYKPIKGMIQDKLEDPVAWFSGGFYHIVVNSWGVRKAFHLTSANGIDGWKLCGTAYEAERDFIRYTDGTVNRWNKLERPGVILQNGHVTHFIFAVLDVPKKEELGNDRHGSKIIIVPFDGEAFDRDLPAMMKRAAQQVATETRVALRTADGQYVSMAPGGKLRTRTVASLDDGDVFLLNDSNGGELADGDVVTIATTAEKPTYWYENKAENVIYRIGGLSGDTSFTVKRQGKRILLRTASGRYVGPAKAAGLTSTDQEGEALALEVIENPSVATPSPRQ